MLLFFNVNCQLTTDITEIGPSFGFYVIKNLSDHIMSPQFASDHMHSYHTHTHTHGPDVCIHFPLNPQSAFGLDFWLFVEYFNGKSEKFSDFSTHLSNAKQ